VTHASSTISGLRSVALNVPDLAATERFFTETWRLELAARGPRSVYLRGSGGDHHVVSLHEAAEPASVRHIALRARSASAFGEIANSAAQAGATVSGAPAPFSEPGGGSGFDVVDPHGRIFRIVHGDERREPDPPAPDRPIRLAHAVLNSHDCEASREFLEKAFDFSLSDRTRMMAFMRCNSDHHSIAFGDTDNDALNHIAFLMSDLDSVMRGGGRLRDAGYPIEWGPGRHGPGDNAFNYFVGPFDIVVEYTAEVQQIDDNYRARGPADWKWPPGRVDQWGISTPPSDRMKAAQRAVNFAGK
jgi:catechol 2,3-dioxygenase